MGSSSKVPTAYQPTGSAAADTQNQQLFNATTPYASSLPGSTIPQVQSQVTAQLNNPYAATAQSGANTVATQGGPIGQGQIATGQSLVNLASSANPYAQQILQTGFDPQQLLYTRTQQQLIDQQNAINAMNGVAGTPYGAGTTGMVDSNFNIDWQNAQLARQAQALAAFNNNTASVGAADTTGSDLQNKGLQTLAASSALPSQTYSSNIGTNLAALNSQANIAGAALSPAMNEQTALDNYLKVGQSATQINQQAEQMQYQQDQAGFAGLMQLFGLGLDAVTGGGGGLIGLL